MPRTAHGAVAAIPAVAPAAFPRKRFVHAFTSRFRGDATASAAMGDAGSRLSGGRGRREDETPDIKSETASSAALSRPDRPMNHRG